MKPQFKWNVSEHGWYLTIRGSEDMLAFITRPIDGFHVVHIWMSNSPTVKPTHKCYVNTLLEGQRLSEDFHKVKAQTVGATS